jgi:hypothetical protein
MFLDMLIACSLLYILLMNQCFLPCMWMPSFNCRKSLLFEIRINSKITQLKPTPILNSYSWFEPPLISRLCFLQLAYKREECAAIVRLHALTNSNSWVLASVVRGFLGHKSALKLRGITRNMCCWCGWNMAVAGKLQGLRVWRKVSDYRRFLT